MLSLREPRNRSPRRDPPSTLLAARLLKFRKANRLPSTYGPRRFTGLHARDRPARDPLRDGQSGTLAHMTRHHKRFRLRDDTLQFRLVGCPSTLRKRLYARAERRASAMVSRSVAGSHRSWSSVRYLNTCGPRASSGPSVPGRSWGSSPCLCRPPRAPLRPGRTPLYV